MCGIAGLVRFEGEIQKEEIRCMNRAQRHRGPDDEGWVIFPLKDYHLGMGHMRLAILDLSPRGHQPMGYDLGRERIIFRDDELHEADLILVFNGEIYNYLELKEKFDLTTQTGTDTEVILRLYAHLGPACVREFNGMWAFALYDRRKDLLFLSRDRLGVKPLFYYWDGREFIFASELKAILAVKPELAREANVLPEAVELYFALGFIPSPWSIFRRVFKLPSRTNLFLDLKRLRGFFDRQGTSLEPSPEELISSPGPKDLTFEEYWELPDFDPIYDKKALIKKGRELLYDAVRLRMRSDVPVGAFLSGGLDSSTVVAVMREFTDPSRLHTFSIGFEGKYDETPYINIVKDHFGTRHHHYYFTEKDFEELLEKFCWMYDEPFGDYSGFPTHRVSEMARREVTVVLSGDGGDEVFGGYINHVNGYRMDFIRKLPMLIRLIGSKLPVRKNLDGTVNLYLLKEALKLSLTGPEKFYAESIKEDAIRPEIYKIWTTEKMKYCLEKGAHSLGESLRIFDLLFNTLPDHFLVKVDRASMVNALEVRSPFLDYSFAEFGQKIPTDWKIDLFRTKKMMREMIRDFLPKEIFDRGKQGFTPPISDWILREKYLNRTLGRLEVLKKISSEIYSFFKGKVFENKEQSLYRNYLTRFFLFIEWWERWTR